MPGYPDVSPVGLWARERQDYTMKISYEGRV